MFIVVAISLAVAAVLLTAILLLVGFRAKSRVTFRIIRWLARRVMNPQQMKSAGTPGAYASIIRHEGRKTGTPYETPVDARALDDGFVITLPYGERPNWFQNVMASGSASIVHEGRTHTVGQPRVVPMGMVEDLFSGSEQRTHRIFGVDQVLRVARS